MGSSNSKKERLIPEVFYGEYSVGCADIMTAPSLTQKDDEGVFARIYYPIEKGNAADRRSDCPAWVPRGEYLDGMADFSRKSRKKFYFLYNWKVGKVAMPAAWHAPLADSDVTFPVIVFSHGMGGTRFMYSVYCSTLASHGFIVAAVEHRDRSASWTYTLSEVVTNGATNGTANGAVVANGDHHANGVANGIASTDEVNLDLAEYEERPISFNFIGVGECDFKYRTAQLHQRVSECVACLHLLERLNLGVRSDNHGEIGIVLGGDFDWTQFKDRLDLSRASVAGHSFGGGTAVAATAACPDFRCAVVLDGWLYPLHRESYASVVNPLLFINSYHWQWKANIERMQRLLGKEHVERLMLTIKESVHQSSGDLTYLVSGYYAKKLQLRGKIDPILCGEIAAELSLAFLHKHMGMSEANRIPRLIKERRDWLIQGTNVPLVEERSNL